MTLHYDSDIQSNGLESILDEYTDWFSQAVRRIFFASDMAKLAPMAEPKSFEDWLNDAVLQKKVDSNSLVELVRLHSDLRTQGDGLMKQKNIVFKDFDQFASTFDQFVQRLRRISGESKTDGSALDPLSGLRRPEFFQKDIQLEMERLTRKGNPFSIALIRMNDYEQFLKRLPKEEMEACIVVVSSMIKKLLRAIDDAYRLENGQFLLCLKQTARGGGLQALQRLENELTAHDATYEISGITVPLTISSCVAEPLPGDDVAEILANMNEDLDEGQRSGKNVIVEYRELSPLQRFIKEGLE